MKKQKKKKTAVSLALVPLERKEDLATLAKLLDGDLELAKFFLIWTTNGNNATTAYMDTHPLVSYHSARTLGSKWLAKVDIAMVLEVLDLGLDSYLKQLKEGLKSMTGGVLTKFDKAGNVVAQIDMRKPDNKVRRLYHEAQGRMLGVEKDSKTVNTQFNFDFTRLGTMIASDARERGLQA